MTRWTTRRGAVLPQPTTSPNQHIDPYLSLVECSFRLSLGAPRAPQDVVSCVATMSTAVLGGFQPGKPLDSFDCKQQHPLQLFLQRQRPQRSRQLARQHTNQDAALLGSETHQQHQALPVALGVGAAAQLNVNGLPSAHSVPLISARHVQESEQQRHHASASSSSNESSSDSHVSVDKATISCSGWLQPFKVLFAGALAAVVSRSCVAPLERIKLDLVLKNSTGSAFSTAVKVWQTEGPRGFWKGNLLNVIRTAPFKAVNFFAFDSYHHLFVLMSGGKDGNAQRFAAGGLAGITATLLCFPLDVLRTRMMAPGALRYGGPLATLTGMVQHEGVGALYAGIAPALVGMAPSGAVFYGVYDMLKSRHLALMDAAHPEQEGHHRIGPGPTLLYGAISGACSELAVYPLEILRRRMQLQSMTSAAVAAATLRHEGGRAALKTAATASISLRPQLVHMTGHQLAWAHVVTAVAAITATDGLRGFYCGLLPNLMQVLPSAALSYLTYDQTKIMLGVMQ